VAAAAAKMASDTVTPAIVNMFVRFIVISSFVKLGVRTFAIIQFVKRPPAGPSREKPAPLGKAYLLNLGIGFGRRRNRTRMV
jgi:hypothetical protein